MGAGRCERSPQRRTYRRGHQERVWVTGVGEIPLRIPKLREGNQFPSLLEPRRRAERALLAVVQADYVQGARIRRVDELLHIVPTQHPVRAASLGPTGRDGLRPACTVPQAHVGRRVLAGGPRPDRRRHTCPPEGHTCPERRYWVGTMWRAVPGGTGPGRCGGRYQGVLGLRLTRLACEQMGEEGERPSP
ncbi:MAG: transposase [Anaerolineales bacterium]|nr:transposase [Anaerolineales bacterium]